LTASLTHTTWPAGGHAPGPTGPNGRRNGPSPSGQRQSGRQMRAQKEQSDEKDTPLASGRHHLQHRRNAGTPAMDARAAPPSRRIARGRAGCPSERDGPRSPLAADPGSLASPQGSGRAGSASLTFRPSPRRPAPLAGHAPAALLGAARAGHRPCRPAASPPKRCPLPAMIRRIDSATKSALGGDCGPSANGLGEIWKQSAEDFWIGSRRRAIRAKL
jgi:hypothetical protein